MTVVFAADHAGYEYKTILLDHALELGCAAIDLTPERRPDDDYPDVAALLAEAIVREDAQRGVLVCGSGVGVGVAANKFPGIRAGVCHDTYSAHQAVEHDNINVLAIGQRVIGIELARDVVRTYLNAVFSGRERHCRRIEKIAAIEHRTMGGPGPA